MKIEAYHHAAAANNVEHAARLMESDEMTLHFCGSVVPVLTWLESLPMTVQDARSPLWLLTSRKLVMTILELRDRAAHQHS